MKKIITILFCVASLNSVAQLNSTIGLGYNFNNHPIYSLNLGYEIGRININGGFQRSLTRSTSSSIIAGAEIGLNLFNAGDSYLLARSIIISAGYWNVSGNSDQKLIKSQWLPSISLRGIKMFTENGGLFGQVMCLKNNLTITIGMILKFN
jgi:hypothetical protein